MYRGVSASVVIRIMRKRLQANLSLLWFLARETRLLSMPFAMR